MYTAERQINCGVTCSSSNRCRSIFCCTCRWRFSGHIARRILPEARRFFAAEIDIRDASFRSWASRVRNVIEYRRAQQSRWWKGVSLVTWLQQDKWARGIAALGSIQDAELTEAFERWPTTVRPVAADDVRNEIYHILHPTSIALIPYGRRYQSICFYVGRRRLNASHAITHREPMSLPIEIEAMPCIF